MKTSLVTAAFLPETCGALALLQVLLWFISPVYSFHRSLQWALELGCDCAVLAGRLDGERRSYAAALLAQLEVQLKTGV